MGTVPLLLTVLVTLISLPLYVWRTAGERVRPVAHLVIPLLGVCVIGWGVYGNVRPDQPYPGSLYWIFTAGTVVLAALGAARFARRPRHDLSALGISRP